MFGIETFEILIFFRQVGLAVAGAAAFWGSVFLIFSRRSSDARSSALWQGVSQKMLLLLFPAIALFGIAWAAIAISQCVFCVSAHEGISTAETSARLIAITHGQFGLYVGFMLAAIAGLGLLVVRRKFFHTHIAWFYGVYFLLISVFLLYPWVSLGSVRSDLSAALHGWHSVFTVGSVILVDFLFIALRANLRPYLTKIFPLVTAGIWIGLGLDFVNAGLVFREEFVPVARILFIQTLIGIIIINGVLLSGPLSRIIIAFQERMGTERLSPRLQKITGLSGAISVSAWISVTALDGFRSLTLAYWQLALVYVLFVTLLFISREPIEKLLERYAGSK